MPAVTNTEILLLNQAGKEATRGTGVAATRKMYNTMEPQITKELQEFIDRSGTFHGLRRPAYQRMNLGFSMNELLTFEDLAFLLQYGIKGGVTGVTDAGTPPAYTYTFVPSMTADDISALTLEWNFSGIPLKSTQVMLNTWTINIVPDSNGGWMMEGSWLGRDVAGTTFTPAIPERTTEVISAPGTKLYIDDATLGSTQRLNSFIRASVTYNQNLAFLYFGEHTDTAAADLVLRGLARWDAEIELNYDSDAERLKYMQGAERFIRLQSEGTIIHTTVRKRARIDLNGFYRSWARDNRNGQLTQVLGFTGYVNAASGYDGRMEVVNALATIS